MDKQHVCPRCGDRLVQLRPNRYACQACTAGYAKLTIWSLETLQAFERNQKEEPDAAAAA